MLLTPKITIVNGFCFVIVCVLGGGAHVEDFKKHLVARVDTNKETVVVVYGAYFQNQTTACREADGNR